MVYASILAWLTAGPILLQTTAGGTPIEFGFAALITGLSAGAGTLINGRLVGRFGIKNMLRTGLSITIAGALSMLIIALFSHRLQSWQVVAPMCIFMCGASFVFANAVATALNPFPENAGSAGSLSAFIQLTGGGVASALMGYLPETTQLPLAMTITTAAILAWIIFLNCKKQIV
jgi:MFS family permease